MKYKKKIWFYKALSNIVLPIDNDNKHLMNESKKYESKTLAVGEKIIVDEEGVWVKDQKSEGDYIKLLSTKEFIDINCPNIFQKTS